MSDVSAVVAELQHLGVTLWYDGDRIRYRAPKGTLTTELLDRLRTRKDEIASFLAAAGRATGRDGREIPAVGLAGDGPAPLSFAQEGIWFLHQLGGRNDGPGAAYNVATVLRLRGLLDAPALQRSLEEIVRRHAILRTRFVPSDEGGLQIVENGAAPVKVRDLSSTPAAARENVVRAIVEAETAHAFALDRAPPVRLTLLRLGRDDHVLVSVLHHMVTDGWSMWVLFGELQALYRAFKNGQPSPLPDLSLQYADHAVYQRRTLTGDTLAAASEYWRRQMAGAPAAIDLPLDRPRPAQQSYRGAVLRFELDGILTDRLKRLAQDCKCSLFMVLLAGFSALLSRYADQTDVVIGTPVANRDRLEIESLIGVFSNYLPQRVDLSGNPTIRELIARVRRMTLAGYAHQSIPFDKLVDAVRPERRMGAAPLFQVAMVLQNLPVVPLSLSGIDVQQIQVDRATAKLDLSVLFEEAGGIICGELEYCTDLFEPMTATRIAHHLVRTLEAFGQDPDGRVGGVPLLGDDERNEILGRWSGAADLLGDDGVLHERFRAQAARTPEAVAVVAGGERLSYAELSARVSRLARHLASLGVAADSRVAVCLPRSADLIVTILAVLEAGGAYLPLDSEHPPERLAFIVADAGADIAVTIAALRPRVPQVAALVCLDCDADAISRHASGPLGRPASPDQLAYIIYTSGSTGRPKGVMVPHRAGCSLVRALADSIYARLDEALNVALVASTVFDASVQQIFACLLLGHALHVVDDDARQSGDQLLRFFETHGVALSDGTPSLLGLLLDAGLGTRPGALTHLLIGGEALSARLIERLHAQDKQRRITVTNVYGPTECGVDATYKCVLPGEPAMREHVAIGRPLSNSRLYILDGDGAPVPAGIRGDIWIGGPCLGRGYFRQPALTAKAYRPDPFVPGARLFATGDRGRWTNDGDVEFLGRCDDQVKVRGYRVELAEIESALLRYPAVKEAVIVIDRSGVEAARLVAYVTPRAGAPTTAELRDHLASLLPAYMVPSAFMVIDRFPLNASGKVDRSRMPDAEDAREMAQGVAYVAPQGAREESLATAWAAVLGRETIGSADNFFALGGDSIKALQVVSKVRQAGLRLELRDLFLHPTLSMLAPLLKPLLAPAAAPKVSFRDVPLGPVQAAFLQGYPGPKHHFHQALLLAPGAQVDPDALDLALAAVFAHHDALRARFRRVEDRWVQAYGPADNPPVTEIVDLSRVGSAPAAMRTHATATMAATDLARGPLLSVVLYRLPAGERLLLAAHHLIVDGVSWRIMIEDIDAAYGQALAGNALSLTPVSDSYAQWAAGMRTLSTAISDDERNYWLGVEQATSGPLPLDAPRATAYQRDRAERRLSLAQNLTTQLLSSAHDAYNTRMDDLLLAALGRGLAAWSGVRQWRVLLEGHGREPLWDGGDVSRTVGWFTARYPVLLDLAATDNVGRQIKLVKEMLRAVPHKGGAYESARGLPAAVTRNAPMPAIAFNYLGQLGRDLRAGRWAWMDEDTGSTMAPDAPLIHDLEIVGFVAEDRLHLAILYGSNRFTDDTVSRLAAALERALLEIIEHTMQKQNRELTPSDIDYDGFDIDALDRFLKNL
jgi:amino acid adenylation domain-containing protein/non-ribosomal peptide synthase protein (TIGR01720 family)